MKPEEKEDQVPLDLKDLKENLIRLIVLSNQYLVMMVLRVPKVNMEIKELQADQVWLDIEVLKVIKVCKD